MEELSPHEQLPPYPGEEPRQPRSPLRCLIPCCALVLLLGALCLGGVYAWVVDSQVTAPKDITQLVQEVLPGQVPSTLSPKFGSKLGFLGRTFRLALFVHADPTRLAVAVCDVAQTPPEYLHMQVYNLVSSVLPGLQQQPTAVSTQAIELKVGQSILPAQERIITTAGGVKIREVFVLLNSSSGVMFSGHQAVFDQATMDAYLAAIVKAPSKAPADRVEKTIGEKTIGESKTAESKSGESKTKD